MLPETPPAIHATGLTLHPATIPLLEAELAGIEVLATHLGAEIPSDWPPGEYDRDALAFFHEAMVRGGAAAAGWYGWYALAPGAEAARPVLVGTGGYFGPPDAAGMVEVGYSICAAHRGRGHASALLEALVAHAWASGRVTLVCAHTTPANVASVRVLEKCGFRLVGPGAEPGSVRYEHHGRRLAREAGG